MLKPPPINPEILSLAFHEVGFALWQIQELENAVAHYLIIVHKVKPGTALDAAEEIFEKNKRKTLGQLTKELKSKETVPKELMTRLSDFVDHRNWLAHRSRAESREHIYQQEKHHVFFERVSYIAEESLQIGKLFCTEIENYVQKHGVSKEYIESTASKIMRAWKES